MKYNFRILTSFVTAVIAFAIISCGETKTETPTDTASVNVASATGIPDFTKSLEGSIDGKYGIIMTLTKSGNELNGTYSYKTHAIPIKLTGTIDDAGAIVLNGFDDKGNTCDLFKGTFAQNGITGTWSKPDGSKSMPFSVSESSNTENGMQRDASTTLSKKDILTGLIGEHSLQSISGFMGANTMMDYSLSGGKWSASGSMLSNGQREPYDIDLSKSDLQKLNSMKIVVSSDLSVSLSCSGKVYFNAPFSESGMTFSLSKTPNDYSTSMPASLSRNSTFVDGDLYLFAKDNMSSELESADIADVGADAAILKYDTKTNSFELTMFASEGSGNSAYSFK